MPRVTVCMPVYNGASRMAAALESVRSQSYRDFDVLVLDDGSTDGTAEVAKQHGCRVVSVPNGGNGAARKRLMEEAQGELVAFIDDDDVWLPGKLEKQVQLLDETAATLVHTDCWYIYDDGVEEPRDLHMTGDEISFDHILPNNSIITSSVLFRREAILRAGNFLPDLIRCSDWYGWMILAPTSRFVHLPEKLVRYTVRRASLANAGFRFYQAQNHLLTKHFLPRTEELFRGLDEHHKQRYTRMLDRDVGLALSGMARTLRASGQRGDARRIAVDALLHAPASTKVWGRALSCLLP